MVENSTILVIDDDPGVRNTYEEILCPYEKKDILSKGSDLFDSTADRPKKAPRKTYDATFAECGQDGIRAVESALRQNAPFAVAFIDMNMPGLDGAETAKGIWEIDSKIKIVIVTAYSEYTPENIVRMTGRDDIFYLRKPFNAEEIRQFARALTRQWNLENKQHILSERLKETNLQLSKSTRDLKASTMSLEKEIEQRKRSENALRESKDKYQAILENMEESYMEVDLSGNILFFNKSLCRLTGYSEAELRNINYRQLMDGPNAEKLFEIFSRVYEQGLRLDAIEMEIIIKDNSKRYIDASVSLITDEKGQKVGFRGVGRDRTDRKLAEIALHDTQAALTKKRDEEMDIAARIQKTLLLGKPPKDMEGIHVYQMTIPSQAVDGDFYDFYKTGDRSLDILVGDVMGKGIPSALVGAAVKTFFLRVFNKQTIFECHEDIPRPEDIVASVHAGMIQEIEALETFVTLCYARFDLAEHHCRFVDCGHMRTIHFHHDSGSCSLLEGVNMPLGFPETQPFKQASAAFRPGDLFYFYSDGITEAKNMKGEMYGEQRLVDFVRRNSRNSIESLVEATRREIVRFSGSEKFEDDFTCVAVRIENGDRTERIVPV